jgi:preprotein translocase subunit YajC
VPLPAHLPGPLATAPLAVDGGFDPLVMILIVVLIFYFLVIRPAGRERKAREARIRSLEKHDRVVTNAGIHGTVVALDDDTVTLRVDDKANCRIRFSRAAVWQVLGGEAEPAGAEKEKGAPSPTP